MTKSQKLKKIAIGTLISGYIGFAITKFAKTDRGMKLKKSIIKEKPNFIEIIKLLNKELSELINEAESDLKKSNNFSLNKHKSTIYETKETKNKMEELLKSIKKGKIDNKEINNAIKEAEKAIKKAKAYFLDK